jgi:enoyl-[acyl-carrier protein] reductase II
MGQNRICSLLGIKYPIIQGGMVWCSGWKLASAVSNAGGLGLLGAGSMYPGVLREHIAKMKTATNKPWGVNVPLLYPDIEVLMDIIISEGVKIVFTSAGSPKKWTQKLQENGIIVIHVISSAAFAAKCEEAGVDAIVAEGFEAGGHNGREETTSLALIPNVRKATKLPVIAAGGIATGGGMLAAFALGAEGVQCGSVFAACAESSAHQAFKDLVVRSKEGDTMLTLKLKAPVRMLKNEFYGKLKELEERGAKLEEFVELLGKGRSKKGIFEGDLNEGELEIGQVCSLIDEVKPAKQVVDEIIAEFNVRKHQFAHLVF